jgi:hypothetical protein
MGRDIASAVEKIQTLSQGFVDHARFHPLQLLHGPSHQIYGTVRSRTFQNLLCGIANDDSDEGPVDQGIATRGFLVSLEAVY